MATYSDDEFLIKLQGATQETNAHVDVDTASVVAPPIMDDQQFSAKLSAALGQPMEDTSSRINALPRSVSAVSNLSLTEREGRRDESGQLIPIDVSEGIPRADYYAIAQQRNPEDQLAVLQKIYPGRNARILDSGDLAVEVIDSKTGKPKDVTLNPAGLDAHDLLDLAVQTPEIVAGIATAIATQGRGILKTTAQMILSSLATGVTGAARDAAARGSQGLPIQPGEIASSRGASTALDLFSQASLGVLGKSLRALSPFAKEIKPGSLEFDLEGGSRFLKDVYGVDIKRTPSEITGSPALAAIEAIETPQPGARNVLGKLRQKREEDLKRVQSIATGKVAFEEEIGARGVGILREKVVLPIENAITAARTAAEAKGQARLVSEIDKAIGTPTTGIRMTPTMAGVKTLEEFETRLARAENLVDEAYAKVNALPGGTGDVLSGDAASRAASDIRKELPKVLKKQEKETGLLDEFGRPQTREVETAQVLSSGVPEGLQKALSDLESLKGGKVSLQTLTNMKRAAYDEIAKTEAVPGVKERWFNKIASAYEQGIQKGIDETGDPALKAALTNAKDTYKRELLPFDRPGIKEMAKGEFDAARLSPEQITSRLFDGPRAIENYRMLKETLGANSQAFRVLKRSWVDTQLAAVSDPITGTINAQKLLDSFTKLKVDKPELAEEMFGTNYAQIYTALRGQSGIQNIGTIDATEIKTLLSMKNPTRSDFEAIMRLNKNRAETYMNGIIQDVADGVEIGGKIEPTEFISRLRNTKTPTTDVAKVLDVIAKESPETREAISTLTFYKILNDASVSEGKTAVQSMAGEPINISAKKLAEAIGKGDDRARNKLLLGGISRPTGARPPVIGAPVANPIDVLEALAKVQAPREAGRDAFGAAGGLAQGSAVLQAVRNPLKYATTFAKNLFIAVAYTSEMGTKLVSNRMFGPEETAAIANAMIASEPFLLRATEAIGPDKASGIVSDLKRSIDQFVNDQIRDTPQRRDAAEIRKLQQGQPANVRQP